MIRFLGELLPSPVWLVKTLDTFGSFEISNLEKAHEHSEACNIVTTGMSCPCDPLKGEKVRRVFSVRHKEAGGHCIF